MGSVMTRGRVQDTLARAFVALDELRDTAPLRAWLFRIAHNRALDLCAAARSRGGADRNRPRCRRPNRPLIPWRT